VPNIYFDTVESQGFTATLSDFTPVTTHTEPSVAAETSVIAESSYSELVLYDLSDDDNEEEVDPTTPMGRGCRIRFERRLYTPSDYP
jgi:hypothetical protein